MRVKITYIHIHILTSNTRRTIKWSFFSYMVIGPDVKELRSIVHVVVVLAQALHVILKNKIHHDVEVEDDGNF